MWRLVRAGSFVHANSPFKTLNVKLQQTWMLLVVVLLIAVAPASARKWTNRTGKFSVEAELVEVKDGNVRLKQESGKIITVAISELSKTDRDYLASVAKKKPEVTETTVDAFSGEIGKLINVEMTTDLYYRDVKLLEVARDENTGEWSVLKLEVTPSPFDMSAKKKVISVTSRRTHRVLGDDGTPLFESRKAQQESRQRQAWRERLAARRVLPWPHLTRAKHEEALAHHRKYVKEVSETFRNLRLYETDFFLFSSDIPAAQARPFIKALDTMHHAMCKMYRIKRGTPVWKGKAVIIAFSRRAEYVAFQQKFMQNTPAEHNHGRCRSYRSGRVIISAYYFGSASQFAQLLVHETTHGVNHRFRTTVHLPSWINEGIADVVGDSLVPMCKTVKGKESVAMRALKKTPRVGANFFDTNRSIETWQYGVASSLTRFLIKTNPQSFAAFIEGIKEGMTAEESLRRHYGVTFPELLTAYGRAVGVPNLRN